MEDYQTQGYSGLLNSEIHSTVALVKSVPGSASFCGSCFKQLVVVTAQTLCCRQLIIIRQLNSVESSWNVMAHGDGREVKRRGNWRMDWVASTLHTTSEHVVSSITTADAHTSAVSSRLNWRPRRFKWTRPFRRKTKSGFCACAITFQTQSTIPTSNQKPFRQFTTKPLRCLAIISFYRALQKNFKISQAKSLR